MITESLNRKSIEVENPSQNIDNLKKVNIGVLKQRLILEKKKEKFKKTIFLSSLIASVGIISFLTY